MTTVRQAAVAGQFYEGGATALREQIEATFEHEHGPGSVPEVADGTPAVRALVAPHAGYPYSGPVAAHGYGELVTSGTPDAIVLVGPNHRGIGEPAALSGADAWATPLGEVAVDAELSAAIAAASETVTVDERSHDGEHSLEVQVPFLQYFYEDVVPIVPICLTRQDRRTVEAVGEGLVEATESTSKDVVVVASTDLTHYRPQPTAEQQDAIALDAMRSLDGVGLLETVSREEITMCGPGPTAIAIDVAVELGASDATVLKYATSGAIAGRSHEVVGYGSVVLR